MKLLKFNTFGFKFFKNSKMLTIAKDVFLHVVSIVQLSYREIDLLEPTVIYKIMSQLQYWIDQALGKDHSVKYVLVVLQ